MAKRPTGLEESMAENMKRLRDAKGWTQVQLAAAAGVGLDALRKWEQKDRLPGLAPALRLARALGVSVEELAGTEPMPPAEKKGKGKK